MKICFVFSEYPPGPHGGIGSVTRVLGRALVLAGNQVRVVGVYPETFPEQEDDCGVHVFRMYPNRHHFGWVAARRDLFRKVRRWAECGEVDIVEVPDWEGAAAGWGPLPVPVVSRLHGSLTYFCAEMSQPVPQLTSWLERRSWHRSDYSFSTSNYTARRTAQLLGPHSRSVAVLYNPVEVDPHLRSEPRDPNVVVYAGTLTAKKGIVQLIRAWPKVIASHPQAELHVFGKDECGPGGRLMSDHLRSLLAADAVGSVRFHGHVQRDTLQAAFRSCALAVFPSYSEAFALVPMEAMAEACPVVFTLRASGPELIRPELDGLLVDPDDVPAITAAILRLLGDHEFAAAVGAAGRARIVSRFATNVLVPQNEHDYQCCIDGFSQTRRLPSAH